MILRRSSRVNWEQKTEGVVFSEASESTSRSRKGASTANATDGLIAFSKAEFTGDGRKRSRSMVRMKATHFRM